MPARARLHASHVGLVGLLALAGATFVGPHPLDRGAPHVLLITIDTVRADHCSVYGYARPTTPVLEEIARDGVVFDDAYAPMATTAPAHASLFTGLAPARHGIVKNGLVLPARFETLAEHLTSAGYDTAAVVSSFAVHGKFGFRQGFATYDDRFDSEPNLPRWQWEGFVRQGAFDRDARLTTFRGVHWLRSERDRRAPFFLWVHYFDPHHPHDPPAPYDRLFASEETQESVAGELATTVARYDAEIRETDDAIGVLLAELDAQQLRASTLVVVAGDHGEGLMDHDWMHHGLHLYEEAIRVPLVARWPGHLPAGQRLAGPVQLADLAPTILELAGAGGAAPINQRPPSPTVPTAGTASATTRDPTAAVSLVSAMAGTTTLDPARPMFFQRRRYDEERRRDIEVHGEKHAVRVGPWKYIEAPAEHTYELYDLAHDPGETRNLAASEPARTQRLATDLAAWRKLHTQTDRSTGVPDPDAARLRALGYVD